MCCISLSKRYNKPEAEGLTKVCMCTANCYPPIITALLLFQNLIERYGLESTVPDTDSVYRAAAAALVLSLNVPENTTPEDDDDALDDARREIDVSSAERNSESAHILWLLSQSKAAFMPNINSVKPDHIRAEVEGHCQCSLPADSFLATDVPVWPDWAPMITPEKVCSFPQSI